MAYLGDTVSRRRTRLPSIYRSGGKRVFDLLFVLVAAPIVFPLVLVFALIIRRDGGPAFFKQSRVGKNGKLFSCLKLRTMAVDADKRLADLCAADPDIAAEWTAFQKLANDPRITRFGKFLRATSLDELPQFWNILVGDMSLIGPRPFMPEQEALYSDSRSAAYFKLRPGVSGAWQVSSRNASTFAERFEFDEEYYANLTFAGDIKTVLKTVVVVLRHQGS